ncbi:MAG: MgtC/SapB family protein [Calditrichaeota bacterium]|nr:MAG: MgtC/SapB family protein [Calditrichota bacterium]
MGGFSDTAMGLVFRLLAAAFLGGLIGLERDIHGRAAGLRTHLLVGMGAALFTIISEMVAQVSIAAPGGAIARSDPGRIAAQVVTGIGFLGAGVILKEGLNIRGLTTAACLWLVAAIGMACGAALYTYALSATGIGLFALIVLNRLEKSYRKDYYRTLTLTLDAAVDVAEVIRTVERPHLHIIYCDYRRDYQADRTTLSMMLRLYHRGLIDQISQNITRDLEAREFPLHSLEWKH